MSRLIDADEFIDYLGLDAENARKENLGEIVTLEDFDRQPTAYDVDKVVEQLEALQDISGWDLLTVQHCLKIVKAGEVNE